LVLLGFIKLARRMIGYTFGMAVDNQETDKTHFLNQGVLTLAHGLFKWEDIRVYMEKARLLPRPGPL
jgi:hypothetical protein